MYARDRRHEAIGRESTEGVGVYASAIAVWAKDDVFTRTIEANVDAGFVANEWLLGHGDGSSARNVGGSSRNSEGVTRT